MKLLLILLIHGVLSQSPFGPAYLKNSKLCQPWTCVTSKLFLPDVPTEEQVLSSLTARTPPAWAPALRTAVDICFSDAKPRRYTNTCPGQALLHCLVDNLIKECPDYAHRKEDACAPVATLAGFKYMFSQSRYDNLEHYLPIERRPVWFLKNYFNTKCCNLPEIFSIDELFDCKFHSMMFYFGHQPKPLITQDKGMKKNLNLDKIQIKTPAAAVTPTTNTFDPLSCCDMSPLLTSKPISACNFQVTWDSSKRLRIVDTAPIVPESATTTVAPSVKYHDVRVVPVSCNQEVCIFKKLNMIDDSGEVKVDEMSKLLENYGKKHKEWRSAAARAKTRCLTRPLFGYKSDCQINSVLSCIFDVLSENCPHAKNAWKDPCKHTYNMKNETICQISSSKYGPKNRRSFCDFPLLVEPSALQECSAAGVSKVEQAPAPATVQTHRWFTAPNCIDTLRSTKCLMSELGVLNKYNFLDYFKMKALIRGLTKEREWFAFNDVFLSTLSSTPMYKEHCTSQRKILNVIDAVLMTCPVSKRKDSEQCNKMFEDMLKLPNAPETKVKKVFDQMFTQINNEKNNLNSIQNNEKKMVKLQPYVEVNSDPNSIPPVKIIKISPQVMKMKNKDEIAPRNSVNNAMTAPVHKDSLLRSGAPLMDGEETTGQFGLAPTM